MRDFLTRQVSKAAAKFGISEDGFIEAGERVRGGNASADLGGGLFKERIARTGRGRSGGFRTVFCLRNDGDILFFIIFAKNRKANMDNAELQAARKVAVEFRAFTEDDILAALAAGRIRRLHKEGDDVVTQAGAKS